MRGKHGALSLMLVMVMLTAVGCGGSESGRGTAVVVPDSKKASSPTTPAVAPATTPAPTATTTPEAPKTAAAPAPAPATTPAAATAPAAGAGAYGTIKGKIVWGGGEPPKPQVLVKKGDGSVKDAQVCAANELIARDLIIDGNKGVANIFAYINKPNGSNPELLKQLEAKPVVIDQKNCEYLPYVLGVNIKQKFKITTSDPVAHNVRSQPLNNKPFNQNISPGASLDVALTTAERNPAELKCDIHPWMSGWFFAFDHPFFAVSGADGTFEISGVPAGKQNIVIRHPRYGFINVEKAKGKELEVKAGETVDAGVFEITAANVK